jgi:hypothetical protein
MKRPEVWRCFKNRQMVFSGVKELKHVLEDFKFPSKYLGYFMGHFLGRTNGAHLDVH